MTLDDMTGPDAIESVDIETSPELRRIAEEVAASGKACVLRRDGREVARVVPSAARPRPTDAEVEAARKMLRETGGAWADVDTDALLADIYMVRDASISDRPYELWNT
jgi:hypothetical protein